MPSYDYKCEAGHFLTITRPITDNSPVTCPQCDKATVRVYTAPGVTFNGTGFYSTDK